MSNGSELLKQYARAKYEEALDRFATPGGRWASKGALTYWGKACGLSADDIISDAHGRGVTDRDGDIRRGWNDAPTNGNANHQPHRAREARREPTKESRRVRELIGATPEMSSAWLQELSPCLDWVGLPPQEQTALWMRSAFARNEVLHMFTQHPATIGKPGENILTASAWVDRLKGAAPCGDLIIPNALTGEVGKTTGGRDSYISKDCIAGYNFIVLEFDEMPGAMQCAFWYGFITECKLAPSLLSLTYSGGKSIHGLLFVGARNLLEWQSYRNHLRDMFATDRDARYRADAQAMRERTGTRLPGVRRYVDGTPCGRVQRLLYLNPSARPDSMMMTGS